MKFDAKTPPRVYQAGRVEIADCGAMTLEADEQITFVTAKGREYDVCRKDWGYYATPSLNGRLKNFGFKTALVRNRAGQRYIMLVEEDKQALFAAYLEEQDSVVEAWLDELDTPLP